MNTGSLTTSSHTQNLKAVNTEITLWKLHQSPENAALDSGKLPPSSKTQLADDQNDKKITFLILGTCTCASEHVPNVLEKKEF